MHKNVHFLFFFVDRKKNVFMARSRSGWKSCLYKLLFCFLHNNINERKTTTTTIISFSLWTLSSPNKDNMSEKNGIAQPFANKTRRWIRFPSSAHHLDEKFSFYGDFSTFSFRFRVFFDSKITFSIHDVIIYQLVQCRLVPGVVSFSSLCWPFRWIPSSWFLDTQNDNFDTIFLRSNTYHRAI